MINVKTGRFLEASTNQQCNPTTGQTEYVTLIEGDSELCLLANQVMVMSSQLETLLKNQAEEAEMRALNPALKDLYDQYKGVYALVKTNHG